MHLQPGTITRKNGKTRVSFDIEFDDNVRPGDTFAQEQALQAAFNAAACLVMGEFLSRLDTHGEDLHREGMVWTSKGKSPGAYQCWGGAVSVPRETYQSANGGKTYCPLEDRARIVQGATPYFASIVASKYSTQSARAVLTDLRRNAQRHVSVDYVQQVAEAVGKSAQAKERYHAFSYQTAPEKVAAVVLAADATCTAIVGEDYKHTAVGCLCLMSEEGECLEKVFLANSPEDKKVSFWRRMEGEIAALKEHCGPETPWYGVCDGAPEIQEHLARHCDVVTLDFYHLSTYVAEAKEGLAPTVEAQERWVKAVLHDLKHNDGAAERLLGQLRRKLGHAVSAEARSAVEKAIGYVERNLERMAYAAVKAQNMPIGSGVIEAGCKYIVKQRAGISGARWKRPGLQSVLSLRSLHESSNRWEQFWRQCASFGY
jgi:hypothetical protein